MADVRRLNETLAFIEMNPALWDQTSWLHDFAAIAVELAGYPVLASLWVLLPSGLARVWDAAAELLDLSVQQARRLFAHSNSLAELRLLVAEFGASRPPQLWVPRHARRLRRVG